MKELVWSNQLEVVMWGVPRKYMAGKWPEVLSESTTGSKSNIPSLTFSMSMSTGIALPRLERHQARSSRVPRIQKEKTTVPQQLLDLLVGKRHSA